MAKKTYLDRIQCLPRHKISFTFIAKKKSIQDICYHIWLDFITTEIPFSTIIIVFFCLPAITWLIDWCLMSSSSCYLKQTMDNSVEEIPYNKMININLK